MKTLRPSSHQLTSLKDLNKDLKNLKIATVQLQDPSVDPSTARKLFDILRNIYPILEPDLRPTSELVHNVAFESAIVKIIDGNESRLNEAEKREASIFRTVTVPSTVNEVNQFSPVEEQLFAALAKKSKVPEISSYQSLTWIPSTSDLVERLFSTCKHVLDDHRVNTHPVVFEAILLLEQNRSLWSAKTLQQAILRKKKDDPVFDHEPK